MKNAFTKIVMFFAVAAIAMVLGQGQEQNNAPADPAQHHLKFLTKMLSLTPAQQQQAATIFADAGTSGKTIHEQMRAAHENLKTAIQKNDVATIEKTSGIIGGLTTQMIAAHAKSAAAFYQILTPEQQTEFNQMHEHGGMFGPDMFFHHGPGGHEPGAARSHGENQ